MKRVGLIMAGGAGERFWPESRKHFPKQLLHLHSNEYSMLAESVMRISSVIPIENIFIITTELLCASIRASICKSLPLFKYKNVIPEPEKRNTAPCLALSSAFLHERFVGEEICVAVLTADQVIGPLENFTKTILAALEYVENNDKMLTIGVKPTQPNTGYGYIETESAFSHTNEIEIKPVLRFREKPNIEQAKEYITTGRFTWNSGMFFWRLSVFDNELMKCSPELASAIPEFRKLLENKTLIPMMQCCPELVEIYNNLPAISIDYALMEKSTNVSVCKALFSWKDIGSWDALYLTKILDKKENVLLGKISAVDCKKTILVNKIKDRDVVVAGLGLENMVIIATDDAILVCPNDKLQDIKDIVEDVRTNYGEKHL